MVTKVTDSVMDLGDVNQDIVMNNNEVIGLPNPPTAPSHSASKEYVDDEITNVTIELTLPAGLGPLPWTALVAPPGWLLCDGAAYNASANPDLEDLYNVILTTYGGTGITNFNVPDLRGRFPLGKSTGLGTNRVNRSVAQNLGGVGGNERVTLTGSQVGSHSHPASMPSSGSHIHSNSTSDTEPNHSHGITQVPETPNVGSGNLESRNWNGNANIQTGPGGEHSHNVNVPNNNSSHSHPITVGASPAAIEHENTPPFMVVNYIIKT